MKIKVQLYGVLTKKFPDYQSSEGIDIELPEDAKATDVLNQLKIPEAWGVVLAMENRILNYEDQIKNEGSIKIFQTIHGG